MGRFDAEPREGVSSSPSRWERVAAQWPGEGGRSVAPAGGEGQTSGGRTLARPSATLSQGRGEDADRRDHAVPAWKDWLLLAWATAFGVLYVLMIVQSRAPGLYEAARRLVGR